MKREHQPVTEEHVNKAFPGAPSDACFYCREKLGAEHAHTCVHRTKTVLVEIVVKVVREVPEHWDERFINFRYNESSWCSDNDIEEIAKLYEHYMKVRETALVADGALLDSNIDCFCGRVHVNYVQEATAEDEAEFTLTPMPREPVAPAGVVYSSYPKELLELVENAGFGKPGEKS